ncbi:RDD family protein [Rhizobium sp. R693]|uniref:RDD family protein n=1 Tax=Rhizobium sp. R693 TaxID=1764276 RepID=UPI000B53276E|nr:RDD family protein [Rhizobium sp. R693]OWV90400.1 hypothetical protein ATY79_28585 [Rhizobium sp. R693]
MDIIKQTHQKTLQPRLFWRRAFAYLIDMAIFEALLAVVALIVPLNFGMPLFESTQCGEVTSGPLVEKVEHEWPLKQGEKRENQLCRVTQFLGKERVFFRTTVITGKPDGGTFSSRSVSAALDQNGDPIDPVSDHAGTLAGLLIVSVAFAYLGANGRRTLGKKLLSIRVVTVDGASPLWSKTLKREFLKFSPLIAFVGIDLIGTATASDRSFETMIHTMRDGTAATSAPVLTAVGFLIAALLWWVLPLIRWKGQMFYDRFSGCEVRRT